MKAKIKCKHCNSTKIVKRGFAKKKLQTIQKYQCKNCNKIFTFEQKQAKNKTYPLKIILNSIAYYNLGHTLQKTAEKINRRYEQKISTKTISNWVNEYKEICTYSKLRKKAIKLYKPNNIIFKKTLYHTQPYTFKYHKAKLHLLFHDKRYNNEFTNSSIFYEPLKQYLEKITTDKFPHHIFTYHIEDKDQNEGQKNTRASQIDFKHLTIKIKSKHNYANQLAKLALAAKENNKQRHELIQNLMLINDSTTTAIEVPVYLTNWDVGYYRNQKGFIFPLNNYKTPITGHIDMIQVRNGLIHILDYKPTAHKKEIKEKAIQQLTIYALASSRKLNLPLYYFKCAWFDENNYFEFFPLHAVYKKSKKIKNAHRN